MVGTTTTANNSNSPALPSCRPTAACRVQLQPSSKQQRSCCCCDLGGGRRKRRGSSAVAAAPAAAVPLVAVTLLLPLTSAVTAASLERAILHLWSLAPQPRTSLPSLSPFPSLPALPPSFQSLPSAPRLPFVAASDLAAALGDRVRLSQAGEALAGISAVCRERAERAQGFVADAWAAKRAYAAAAFVR